MQNAGADDEKIIELIVKTLMAHERLIDRILARLAAVRAGAGTVPQP
jgi:hypothetical protein